MSAYLMKTQMPYNSRRWPSHRIGDGAIPQAFGGLGCASQGSHQLQVLTLVFLSGEGGGYSGELQLRDAEHKAAQGESSKKRAKEIFL